VIVALATTQRLEQQREGARLCRHAHTELFIWPTITATAAVTASSSAAAKSRAYATTARRGSGALLLLLLQLGSGGRGGRRSGTRATAIRFAGLASATRSLVGGVDAPSAAVGAAVMCTLFRRIFGASLQQLLLLLLWAAES
jgi:hypothetical protein